MSNFVEFIEKFDILSQIGEFCVSSGVRLIGAILILIIGFKLVKTLVKLITRRGFAGIDASAQTFIKSFLNISLKVLVIVMAAGLLGVPMTSVITIVGSCGIAIGLALQGGLANIAGGLIILIFKPFGVNDYIIEGGFEGTVSSIGIFYTTLVTTDNKRILIPNGALMNSTVTAANQLPLRRVDLTFNVAYSTDIDFARGVIADVAKKNELVLADPETQILLSKHGESAIEFTLRAWTKSETYWDTYFSLIEGVKKAFDKNGIEIPFPQMDVHVKN